MTYGRGRHSGQGRVTEMIATRESRCPVCQSIIEPGEPIRQWAYRRWGHPDCVEYAQRRV